MEETILQNELVREALDWYCEHLEKLAESEWRKAMRAITGESIEHHNAVSLRCQEKCRQIEKLLRQ